MLVEVNCSGKTHDEYAAVSQPCRDQDRLSNGYCLNCGWSPSHIQERGAEVVVHLPWEERNIKWYEDHIAQLKTLKLS